MQKMKSGLMMFCLTVLLSCAALMMNTPTASAMTLQDLAGNYRIVRGAGPNTDSARGSIVTFADEYGDMVCRMTKPSQTCQFDIGDVIATNIFIDNGYVHCTVNTAPYDSHSLFIQVYDNGATLRFVGEKNGRIDPSDFWWEFHRV